jgi:hypothetical protein
VFSSSALHDHLRPVSELESGLISLVEGRVVDAYAVHARTSTLVVDNEQQMVFFVVGNKNCGITCDSMIARHSGAVMVWKCLQAHTCKKT